VQAAGQRLAEAVGAARESFAELSMLLPDAGSATWREEHEREQDRLADLGVPAVVARRQAFQPELVHAPDIIAVSQVTGRSVVEVARCFFLLGERLQIDWLEGQLEKLTAGSRWQRWARQSTEDDLLAVRRHLCERVLIGAEGAPIDDAVEGFLELHAERVERLGRFMHALAMESVTDLAQLTVALRQLRAISG
jgi:glutamate dehydrogenase